MHAVALSSEMENPVPISATQRLRGFFGALGAGAPRAPALRLPDDTPPSIRDRWQARLAIGKRLLTEMRARPELMDGRQRQDSRGLTVALRTRANASVQVESRTLLDGEGDCLRRYGSCGATLVGRGAAIIGTPAPVEAGAMILSAVQHGIRRVVELDTASERSLYPSGLDERVLDRNGLMIVLEVNMRAACIDDDGRPIRGTGGREPVVKRAPEARLATTIPGAQSSLVMAEFSVDGDPLYRRADGSLGRFGPDAPNERLTHRLERLQLPLEADRAIRPDALLAMMNYLGPTGPNAVPTLFQSLDGDRRAAVAAAAREIHDRFHRGGLTASNLEDAVDAACMNVLLKRNTGLIDDPADLATLLAFGDLLMAEEVPLSRREQSRPTAPRVKCADLTVRLEYEVDTEDPTDQTDGSDIASSR